MQSNQLFDFANKTAIPCRDLTSVTDRSDLSDNAAVFVCIRGAHADGHEYAKDAYGRGCRFFVAEHPLDLPDDATVILTENARATLAQLACRICKDPTEHMKIIGITGTKGKTTTAEILSSLLNRAGIPCGYIGTNGISFGETFRQTKNTTPDALTLQKTFSEMLSAGISTAVIEVSSQSILQHRIDGIHFHALLFTNLFPDHIGKNEHPSFADYKACKHRLFTDFPATALFYLKDCPDALDMIANHRSKEVISCSVSESADFFATDIRPVKKKNRLGIAFSIGRNGKFYGCDLPLIGSVNVENALLAAACANTCFSIPLDAISEMLPSVSVRGRSECIPLSSGAFAVIDYAHNGESLRCLLTALREYHPARLICLFGSVGERTQMRRAEMGTVAASLSDLCYLTADNPGKEPIEQILSDIAKSFSGSHTPYFCIPDRKEAIETAARACQTGDILVLAGKGQETYQLIGEKKIPFSERLILSEFSEKESICQ